MRIAMLMTQAGTHGGIELVNRMVLASLLEHPGVEQLFVLSLNDHQLPMPLEDPRVQTALLGGRRNRLVASIPWLRRWDQVLAMHLAVASVGRVMASPKTPLHVVLYGIDAWMPLVGHQRWGAKGASDFWSISQCTIDRFSDANPGFRRTPNHLWPLALRDPLLVRPSHQATGPLRVLLVGRMNVQERYKGHDELIDLWPAVLARFPGTELRLVGGGDDLDRLQEKANRLGLQQAVRFLGRLTDEQLREEYRQAAVFAMPSQREGFGLVYLDAMAAGLPCIAGDQGAAGEVVQDGETGFLVDPRDADKMFLLLSRLLENGGLRQTLGEQGHRRWRSEFGFDRFRERTWKLLGLPALDRRMH